MVGNVTEELQSFGVKDSAEASDSKLATRIGETVNFISLWSSALLIIVSVITVVARVYFRYIVNHDLVWADAFLTLVFEWIIFLGIPRVTWKNSSPRIGIARFLPERFSSVKELLGGAQVAIELAFFGYVLFSAIELLPSSGQTIISTLGISETWATMSVVVGSSLAILALVARMVNSSFSTTKVGGLLVAAILAVGLLAIHLNSYSAALLGIVGALLLDAPIAVALGLGGAAMVAGGQLSSVPTVSAELLQGPTNLALLAIPLFMLLGGVIAHSRLAPDLSRFIKAILGWMPGGIGVASIATAGIFANMSGSAVADSAAIATVYAPQLEEAGYSKEDAAALQASSGVVGVVFPPAIALILYGTVANLDIIQVFKATIFPGLLLVIVMMAIIIARSARMANLSKSQFRFSELVRSIPGAVPALIIPVILDGGILSGVFTPSESGAIAVFITMLIALPLRKISLSQARSALVQAVDGTTLVMFILVAVTVLDYGFTTSGLQAHISSFLSIAGHNTLLFLIIVNLIFLVVHEFVETAPSILVLVPLIMPAAIAVGVNPYQLGAVIAVNSTIGLVLPPVGVSLFVVSQIVGADPFRVLRRIWIYVVGSLVCLALVTFVPFFSTWLPSHW